MAAAGGSIPFRWRRGDTSFDFLEERYFMDAVKPAVDAWVPGWL